MGKKTPESSKTLETRVAMLEVKTDNSSNDDYLQIKAPKLITELILPLTEREAEPDRVT